MERKLDQEALVIVSTVFRRHHSPKVVTFFLAGCTTVVEKVRTLRPRFVSFFTSFAFFNTVSQALTYVS